MALNFNFLLNELSLTGISGKCSLLYFELGCSYSCESQTVTNLNSLEQDATCRYYLKEEEETAKSLSHFALCRL